MKGEKITTERVITMFSFEELAHILSDRVDSDFSLAGSPRIWVEIEDNVVFFYQEHRKALALGERAPKLG